MSLVPDIIRALRFFPRRCAHGSFVPARVAPPSAQIAAWSWLWVLTLAAAAGCIRRAPPVPAAAPIAASAAAAEAPPPPDGARLHASPLAASATATTAAIDLAPTATEIGAAGPEAAGEPPSEDEEPQGRERQVPRRKLQRVTIGAGPGLPPWTLAVRQTAAADGWRGEAAGAPRFEVTLERAGAPTRTLWQRDGRATGWANLRWRVAPATEVAVLVWSEPDDAAPRAWLWRPTESGGGGLELSHLPVGALDWRGDGVEALVSVSTELWQDFLRVGTQRLLRVSDAGVEDLLPFEAFEFCVPAAPQDSQAAALVAVARHGAALHLLAPGRDGRYRSVAQRPVSPPDDGSRWSVPSGFALACLGDGKIQYKDSYFTVRGRLLRPDRRRAPPR